VDAGRGQQPVRAALEYGRPGETGTEVGAWALDNYFQPTDKR
jgi:hypothetical protein